MEVIVILNYPIGPIDSELQQFLREHDKQLSKSNATVILTVFSPTLSCGEISEILEIAANDAWYKGINTNTKEHQNNWALSSKQFVNSKFLEQHLDWLVEAIFDKRLAIAKLRSLNCTVKVRCMLKDWTGIASPEISPDVMARFSQLRIPIQVIFCYMDLN